MCRSRSVSLTVVNTVRPVLECQQWPQAGCAHNALHPAELRFRILYGPPAMVEQQAYSSKTVTYLATLGTVQHLICMHLICIAVQTVKPTNTVLYTIVV